MKKFASLAENLFILNLAFHKLISGERFWRINMQSVHFDAFIDAVAFPPPHNALREFVYPLTEH